MAPSNYKIKDCLNTNQIYIISSPDPLNPGDVIAYNNGIEDRCGTIIEETTNIGVYVYVSLRPDCCECFGKVGLQDTHSLEFKDCFSEQTYNLNIKYFCSDYGSSPNVGDVFSIYDATTSATTCMTYIGDSLITPNNDLSYVGGPSTSCMTCFIEPRSANTETFICIPDCEFTGSTAVSPPHPVWTDGYGISVTQLNMITLGGPNGLNG